MDNNAPALAGWDDERRWTVVENGRVTYFCEYPPETHALSVHIVSWATPPEAMELQDALGKGAAFWKSHPDWRDYIEGEYAHTF